MRAPYAGAAVARIPAEIRTPLINVLDVADLVLEQEAAREARAQEDREKENAPWPR